MARGKRAEKKLTPEEKLAQALVPMEEQPYSVPENWCWVKLSNICKDIRAGGDKPKNMAEIKSASYSVPVIANGIQNDGIIGYTDMETASAGSVTVAGRGTIGFSLVRPYSYYPVVRLIVLNPKDFVIPTYLKYIFDVFEEQGTGSSIPQLTVPTISTKKIPLPPLSEQQRIVARIESLFAKLDEAKDKAQAVVDGFETRKAAILHKAFAGELTAQWRKENDINAETWARMPLESAFIIRSGTTIPAEDELDFGRIPYVKVADMNLPENVIQITTSSRFVNECPASHIIPYGSTIFPKRGGAILTNKKRFVGVEVIIADLNTMAIIPKKDTVLDWYGYYWMQSVDLRELNNGSNVPQINNKDMVKLKLPIPNLKEQAEIVRILDSLLAKEQQAKEAAEAVIDQIDTMKKTILACAFRGELGTNDPAEESVVELLKINLY